MENTSCLLEFVLCVLCRAAATLPSYRLIHLVNCAPMYACALPCPFSNWRRGVFCGRVSHLMHTFSSFALPVV